MKMIALIALLMLLSSGVVSVLYLVDKRRAGTGARRISERALLTWSLLGGWPGAILVGRRIRHKTQKLSYRVYFAIAMAIHLLLSSSLIWLTFATSGN